MTWLHPKPIKTRRSTRLDRALHNFPLDLFQNIFPIFIKHKTQETSMTGEKRPLVKHLSIEEEQNESLIAKNGFKKSYSSFEDSTSSSAHNLDYAASVNERMRQALEPKKSMCSPCSCLFPLHRKKKKRVIRRTYKDEFAFNPATKGDFNIVGWLLACFLFITIGWVCVFTISEGHIDWAELVNYEPIRPSNTLQKRAGFRTLTYMGVGYLLPGLVSLLCLFVGLRLPSMRSAKMSRLVQPPYGTSYWSRWDLLIIFVFVIVLVGTFCIRFWHKYQQYDGDYWDSDDLWHCLTKITGMSLVNILIVVLFPICKTCFWWDLLGLGFDRILKFHRLLGTLFVVFTFVHGLSSVVSLTMREQFLSCLWPSYTCEKPMVTYGWYSGILFLPVFVTSLPWFRRNMYELFYYTHFMVIPALFMAHLHHVNLIYYLSPGLTAYILDKMVGLISSLRPVRLVDLSVPVPGYTRMVLAVDLDNNKFEPGQWIKVKVPAISNREWHPFSITSAPNHSTITLDIKAMGGWTNKLQQLAKSVSSGPNRSLPRVHLDRYQGCHNSQGYLNHPAVLLVAGGIGITPMISVVRTLADGCLPKTRHLVFVWVVKQESVVDLYRKELARYQALGVFKNARTSTHCKIDILVYVTQSEPETHIDEETFSFQRIPAENPGTLLGTLLKNHSKFSPAPFSKTLLGHGHHALLMMAAGIGFMRGIVLGSSIAGVNEWRQEISVLLQLLFGTFFAATLGAIVLTASWYASIRPKNALSDTAACSSDEEHQHSLDIHKRQRPDIGQIVSEMKEQCTRSGIETVGVTICGPANLTKSVMEVAYQASSPALEFVVGEESFEW
jgi:predicted ferric reductase